MAEIGEIGPVNMKAIEDFGSFKEEFDEFKGKVSPQEGEELWQTLKAQLSFAESAQGLQAVNANKPENVKLYDLLRQQLPVYGV